MDRYVRLLVILALVGLSLFRLIRYFKRGLKGRPTAIPGSAGILLQDSTPSSAVASDPRMTPDARGADVTGNLITLLVWAAANAALWLILFRLPALSGIPAIWRLFVGIFANFYLFRFARSLGERRRDAQAKTPETGNPFSD